MGARAERLKAALLAFDARGEFGEDDLSALRDTLAGAVRQSAGAGPVLDGMVGLFFERHLLDDRRRAELLLLEGEALEAAVRHRFRQVISDDHDDHKPYHALRAHVADALGTLGPSEAGGGGFPVSIRAGGSFVPVLVEQAVRALAAEWGARPRAHEATVELLQRYLPRPGASDSAITRDFPEVVRARLDAQRLARGILEVLAPDEKDLMRYLLAGEGAVEAWAQGKNISRATAYRLFARVKALCRVEVQERSKDTKLELLEALREKL